ncbi:MAG: amino acid adenylation domain-containing protein, partial [Gammaproteobacteria bacterium]
MPDAGRSPPPLVPVEFDPFAPAEESFELTEAQREMLAAALMGDEANCVYNQCFVLTLQGPLSPESLRNALAEVVQRHGALRLRMDVPAERQHLLPAVDVNLPVIDLRAEDEATRQNKIADLVERETRTPFDLNVAPLWRALLLREADERHRLVFTAHHLVVDGWSSAVIFGDLARSYAADRFGLAASLPPAASYAEFMRGQLGPEIAAEMQTATDYWVKRFSDGVPVLELPLDAPRPALKTYAAGRQILAIDKELCQALRKTAAQQRTTPFVTLLAAFEVLLARLGDTGEFVIGVPMASQALEDNGHLVAHGVNTLPLLCRVDPEHSFEGHLKSARNAFLEAQVHQRLTFGTLVRKLRLVRDSSRTPLVSVLFNIDKLGSPFDFREISVSNVDAPKAFYNFDLGINVIDDGESLLLECDYNADLFDTTTIARWLSHYREILKGIVLDPVTPTAHLPLLTPDERKQILVDWNATDTPYPEHLCIHQLFEQQVERSPDATAIVFEDQSLSYRELNSRANRLAHNLIAQGVSPDARVAICTERSPAMVVGLLAILKAGGAYVPLDPAYPCERLTYVLADARPCLLLADAAGRDALGRDAIGSLTVLDLADAALADAVGYADNPCVSALTERHLAYVIYTSGSTGTPKGAMNEHRGVVNRLLWMQDMLALDGGDAVLQKTPFAFDVSVWELFLPLITGARLVVARPNGHKDPAYLADILFEEKITTVHFVPSMLAVFLKHVDTRYSAGLRRLVCSGERLTAALVADFLHRLPDVELYNLYGPSEAAVDVTAWHCTSENIAAGVPIGHPVANTRIYILDASGEPVPPSVAGEIFIGGVQVGRGYLGRDVLTHERFLKDPFTSSTSGRMYKTGDLGRWRADGSIEYLGRNDFQVKLRGLRIELGEIEARLTEHQAVHQAVVIALGEGADKHLIAYVVADADPSFDLNDTLREHLSARLPDYMVPAAFVHLDAFPLTPNGKLDRRALPVPDDDALERADYEPPQGDIETELAEVWAELLGVERIGRRDNFFNLGGHSLLAASLINRVAALGAELSMSAVFTSPVFADFSRAVAERKAGSQAALPAIPRIGRDGGLPLSFAQQRLWFIAQLEDAGDTYHVSMVLRLHGSLDVTAWRRALDVLFVRHEALRSIFTARADGKPEVRLLDAGRLPYREDDLRGVADAGEMLKHLCDEEAHAPFDLACGPLIRARVIRMAEDANVVLLTQHHIVFDGWSIGVLARELSALYAAFLRGEPDPLPPLSIQYPDYAAWQREWLTDERLRAQAGYWREALAGAPALLSLPTDRPRPAQQSFAGAQVPIRLDADLTRALRRLGRRHGATLFMTLLAAWATVLARLSGQDDVVIGTPTANRSRAEIEPLIGCFINTLALRVDLSHAPTASELLERVRRRALAAQENQDLPFEQVVEILQPPRRLDHTPLFQVMFAWQADEAAAFDLPGVCVDSVDMAGDSVKFDLELALGDMDDEIVGTLGYATALFDRATIERHVGYLQTVLRAMVAEADRPVQRIEMLSCAERTLLLETWNQTDMQTDGDMLLHRLFEARVARSPQAEALVTATERCSYEELNARANRLAHQLRRLGVDKEILVGVCLRRSVDLVATLLAVLKSGGAYVPLDPNYPADRIAFMLKDSRARVLITTSDLTDVVPAGGARLLLIDQNPEIADCPDTDPENETQPHDLAYVIYTSGSTGVPKGVAIEHFSAATLVHWAATVFPDSALRGVLASTSVCFDLSIFEIFFTLSHGGRLILAENILQLIEHPARNEVTLINSAPSAVAELLRMGGLPDSVRTVCLAGEPLSTRLVDRLYDAGHVKHVYDLYGPTEDTTYSTWARRERGLPATIGRPIANTRAYVLDLSMNPTPIGVAGQLFLGGDGLARGYLNRPELTAERFMRNPFLEGTGNRIYRTGDLARYRPDGEIEYLGRLDHQVKLRGLRIEPGEIEARLTEHPAVREAA